MAIDDGGPAFPTPLAAWTDANHEPHVVDSAERCLAGLSIRDWFAGQALSGLLGSDGNSEVRWVFPANAAIEAYRVADAMLAARKAGA